MTKIQIRKVNGVPMGRPVNPFEKPTERHQVTDWDVFEQSVTEHEAPGFEDGEAEGELVDAVRKDKGKIEIYDVKPLYGIRELGWEEIKVWVLVKPFPETIKEVEDMERVIGNPDANFPVDEQWSLLEARLKSQKVEVKEATLHQSFLDIINKNVFPADVDDLIQLMSEAYDLGIKHTIDTL